MVSRKWKKSYWLLFIIWIFLSGTIFSYAQIKLPGFREMYFKTIQRDVTNWQIYRPDNRLFEFRKDGTINEYQLVTKDFSLIEQQIGRNETGYYKLPDKIEVGDLYKKSGATDELFIPNPQSGDGQLKNIRCRPSATGPNSFWRSCGAIVNPLFDYELESSRSQYTYVLDKDGYEQFDEKYPNYYGSLPIKVRFNLKPTIERFLPSFPPHLDEQIFPIDDPYNIRYNLNFLDKDISLVGNRIQFRLRYAGDIKYVKEILFPIQLCHLDPIYPFVTLSARPEFSSQNNQTYIIFADPQVESGISEEKPYKTDTHCSFANIPMRDLMLMLLNRGGWKDQVLNRVREVKIPISEQVFHKLNSPFLFSNGKGCFYPDVKNLKIGQLSGTLTSAELPLVATSTSKLLFSSTEQCRPPSSERPWVKPKTPKVIDKFRVTFGFQISYQRIGEEVRKYITKHPDVQIKDFSLKYYRGNSWFLLKAKFAELGDQEFELSPSFDEEEGKLYFQVNPTWETLKGKNEVEKELLESIAEDLAAELVFDISGDIEKAKQTATGSHKIEDVTVNLVISKIVPFNTFVNYYGIDFYAVAEGSGNALVELK
ncbi:MAG: hypothetical protein WBD27_07220 [Pyrinomonadaceae bacterium]